MSLVQSCQDNISYNSGWQEPEQTGGYRKIIDDWPVSKLISQCQNDASKLKKNISLEIYLVLRSKK